MVIGTLALGAATALLTGAGYGAALAIQDSEYNQNISTVTNFFAPQKALGHDPSSSNTVPLLTSGDVYAP